MTEQTFRKKPVKVQAIEYTASNIYDVLHWINEGIYDREKPSPSGNYACGLGEGLVIPTLEGDMIARPGDWIIRGVKGEFYPCKSDIFEATYERVAEDGSGVPVSEVRGDEAS